MKTRETNIKGKFCLIALALGVIISAQAQADSYKQILSCDGGAVTVDRDLQNSEYAQVVIRNPQIISYFATRGGSQYINAKNEMILRGENDIAIYQASDFHGFSEATPRSLSNWSRREGRGLRISLNQLDEPANSDCGNGVPMSNPTCQPQWQENATWYFQDCR